MERQAGLGKSLEDVFDSLPPLEPTDPARTNALFGIAPDEAAEVDGTKLPAKSKKKSKKSKGRKQKSEDKKKKKKKKSKKSKGKKQSKK